MWHSSPTIACASLEVASITSSRRHIAHRLPEEPHKILRVLSLGGMEVFLPICRGRRKHAHPQPLNESHSPRRSASRSRPRILSVQGNGKRVGVEVKYAMLRA